jgi:hypothetical protein
VGKRRRTERAGEKDREDDRPRLRARTWRTACNRSWV